MHRGSSSWRSFGIVACLATLLVLAGVADAPLLTFYRVSGNSMRPAFADGDRVLVTCLGGIRAGDAVIVRQDGEILIKRVAAVPGDTVEMLGGVLYRNGEMADEITPALYLDRSYQPLRLLDRDQYFLLGDNRRVSVDSRYFGPVARRDIVGHVVYRLADQRAGRPVTAAEK